MQKARSEGKLRQPPLLRLIVPPDADRRARDAMRDACGLCAEELRARAGRLRAALRSQDAAAALAEALGMRAVAAEFRLHGLLAPLQQIERALRDPRTGTLAALAPLATLESRLEPELAALPA